MSEHRVRAEGHQGAFLFMREVSAGPNRPGHYLEVWKEVHQDDLVLELTTSAVGSDEEEEARWAYFLQEGVADAEVATARSRLQAWETEET